MAHIGFTVAYKMSEQPAATVNCGHDDVGLPVRLQHRSAAASTTSACSARRWRSRRCALEKRAHYRSRPIENERINAMFDYSKMFDLSGRRARAIGGASGIGQASALGLAAHGAEVVVADVNLALAEETVDAIKKGGRKAAAMKIDMRDKAEHRGRGAKSRRGRRACRHAVDQRAQAATSTLPTRNSTALVDLNLKGSLFRVLRAFAPAMAARGKRLHRRLLQRARRPSRRTGPGKWTPRPRPARCR